MARPTCLYCGAALSAEVLEQASSAAKRVLQSKSLVHLEAAALGLDGGPNPRRHIIIDTAASTPEAMMAACSVSAWDVGQWRAASRYRLLKVTTEPEGGPLEAALAEKGLRYHVLTDDKVARSRHPISVESIDVTSVPARCTVREDPDRPPFRRDLAGNDLAIILTAPIKRQKVKDQTSIRKPLDVRLEDGWLVHFHLKTGGRPLELDPYRTAFEGPGLASAHRRAVELVRSLSSGTPLDESFKNATPALSPGAESLTDLSGLGSSQKGKDKEPKMVVVDNVAQFREYSAWRGALEIQFLRAAESATS